MHINRVPIVLREHERPTVLQFEYPRVSAAALAKIGLIAFIS